MFDINIGSDVNGSRTKKYFIPLKEVRYSLFCKDKFDSKGQKDKSIIELIKNLQTVNKKLF